jgi:2-polyprenyl-3-methyl-5-hydroxy-6-metoxy-1,4-benzoquinol methylase
MNTRKYVGAELDVISQAHQWKSYWSYAVGSYLNGRVLEVGAGIGANVRYLAMPGVSSLTLLEPDRDLLERPVPQNCERCGSAQIHKAQGTLESVDPNNQFDTIVYADVLEHIEDDRAELARAESFLCPGGHLVVVAPAHQFLFSEFDRAVGHFRRYNCKSLARLTPGQSEMVKCRYLDSAGMLASLANVVLMRQNLPTANQIRFWDSILVRFSRFADPLLRYSLGRSVVAVWRRRMETSQAA